MNCIGKLALQGDLINCIKFPVVVLAMKLKKTCNAKVIDIKYL